MAGYGLSDAIRGGLETYYTMKDRKKQEIQDAILQRIQQMQLEQGQEAMRQSRESFYNDPLKEADDPRTGELVSLYRNRGNQLGQQITPVGGNIRRQPFLDKPAEPQGKRTVETPYGPISEQYAHNYMPDLITSKKTPRIVKPEKPSYSRGMAYRDAASSLTTSGTSFDPETGSFSSGSVKPDLSKVFPRSDSLFNMINYGQWDSPLPGVGGTQDSTGVGGTQEATDDIDSQISELERLGYDPVNLDAETEADLEAMGYDISGIKAKLNAQ